MNSVSSFLLFVVTLSVELVRSLQRGQLVLVRVQRVSVTRCRSQRPLPEVEHIVGASTEGQQAFYALTQGCCLRPSGEKLKAPIDRRTASSIIGISVSSSVSTRSKARRRGRRGDASGSASE